MQKDEQQFDDGLRVALKRTMDGLPASESLRTKVAGILRAGAPVLGTPTPKTAPRPPLKLPRVLGLPRPLGIAAAIGLFLLGGGLLTYQLREFLPGPKVQFVDPTQALIASLVQVHQHVLSGANQVADLGEFQRNLPSVMPLATLVDPSAKFVGASFEPLNGQTCYVVQYTLNGKPLTLVTANARAIYDIPKYNVVQDGLRLVGGERDGFLVCVMGDSSVAESTYQTLLAQSKMLASPSTQPVSALSAHCVSNP